MDNQKNIEEKINEEVDRFVGLLTNDVRRTGSKGIIIDAIGCPPRANISDVGYAERLKNGLKKNGILVVSYGGKEYGNGEGWYAITVRNIYDKVKNSEPPEPITKSDHEKNSLYDVLVSCVDSYLSVSRKSGEKLEVFLIGNLHRDLVTLAFEEAGLTDALEDSTNNKYMINLEELFKVYKIN